MRKILPSYLYEWFSWAIAVDSLLLKGAGLAILVRSAIEKKKGGRQMKREIIGAAIVCALTASAAFAGKPAAPVDPIAYTDTQIAIEKSERQAADSSEETARNAAISTAVAIEKSERQAADSSEVTARNAAISTAVAIEKSERQAADSSEVTARNAAIATAVGTEKSERLAGEAGLQAQIDALPGGSGSKTKTVNFSPAGFAGQGATVSSSRGACLGNANGPGAFLADVPLPVGAVITAFSATFNRTTSTTGRVQLLASNSSNGFSGDINLGELTVTDYSLDATGTMSLTLATPQTVDAREYFKVWFFTAFTAWDFSICGFSITYNEP